MQLFSKIGLIKLSVGSPSCWVQPIICHVKQVHNLQVTFSIWLHLSQTRVSSSPSAIRAWCGWRTSPLAENTRSTAVDVAGVQNTRLKRGCSKLYCGSKHRLY